MQKRPVHSEIGLPSPPPPPPGCPPLGCWLHSLDAHDFMCNGGGGLHNSDPPSQLARACSSLVPAFQGHPGHSDVPAPGSSLPDSQTRRGSRAAAGRNTPIGFQLFPGSVPPTRPWRGTQGDVCGCGWTLVPLHPPALTGTAPSVTQPRGLTHLQRESFLVSPSFAQERGRCPHALGVRDGPH